ncbi:apextrin [Elysia marginata]|uniref:Apextrin n=1 Tax=Elysia marginata TaxID=1093978 RepID=A0AAV4I6R4_9GAST|nr:apextrin [Elysia marginata]
MILHQVSLLACLLVFHRGLTLPVHHVSDPSMPFLLSVILAPVERYSANKLSLRCEPNPGVPAELAGIFRMGILKESSSGWEMIAQQRDNEDRPTAVRNFAAVGNIKGDISGIFLQVSCDAVEPECFGVFKCFAVGFDSNVDVKALRSSTLEVVYEMKGLVSVSAGTKEKVPKMGNFADTEIARLYSRFQRLTQSIETNQSAFDSRLESLETRLTQQETLVGTAVSDADLKFGKIESYLVSLKERLAKLETLRLAKLKTLLTPPIHWPSGHYALLQPKTGCPVDPERRGGDPVKPTFNRGDQTYLKLHTQSQASADPADRHSSAFSSKTISTDGSKKFVTLNFCETVRSKSFETTSWPQGSFCINKLAHHSCPDGFEKGYLEIDTEDTAHESEVKTNAGAGWDHPWLYFCCKNTTSASAPIQLPTSSPFFLYRYGGACQAVQGMSVSEEHVQINTEDDGNSDRLHDSYPDIDQPGHSTIKLNLCYYTKL